MGFGSVDDSLPPCTLLMWYKIGYSAIHALASHTSTHLVATREICKQIMDVEEIETRPSSRNDSERPSGGAKGFLHYYDEERSRAAVGDNALMCDILLRIPKGIHSFVFRGVTKESSEEKDSFVELLWKENCEDAQLIRFLQLLMREDGSLAAFDKRKDLEENRFGRSEVTEIISLKQSEREGAGEETEGGEEVGAPNACERKSASSADEPPASRIHGDIVPEKVVKGKVSFEGLEELKENGVEEESKHVEQQRVTDKDRPPGEGGSEKERGTGERVSENSGDVEIRAVSLILPNGDSVLQTAILSGNIFTFSFIMSALSPPHPLAPSRSLSPSLSHPLSPPLSRPLSPSLSRPLSSSLSRPLSPPPPPRSEISSQNHSLNSDFFSGIELHYAIMSGRVDMIGRLLTYGVTNVDLRSTRYSLTPFQLSRFSSEKNIFDLLEPFHDEKVEREEREKRRENEKQLKKERERIAGRARRGENEREREREKSGVITPTLLSLPLSSPMPLDSVMKRKTKKIAEGKKKEEIGLPTNTVHLVHVDRDFKWCVEDPTVEFEIMEKLGAGAWGAVHKVRHRRSGVILAMKCLPCNVKSQAADKLRKVSPPSLFLLFFFIFFFLF
jgi:hypothetical protein